MIARYADLLPPETLPRVHEASLEVLERVGILVRHPRARDRFRDHGCRVDADRHVVRFPRRVVDDFRVLIPPTFTFRARNPDYDRTVPTDSLVVSTASSCPNLIDADTGAERRARSADIARIAHLVNALPGIDVLSIPVLADDAPPGQFSLSRVYPAIKNCIKPVKFSLLNPTEAWQIIRLGEAIAGGERAFWDRPFFSFGYCSIVSPLTMDVDSTEMLMFYAERGLQAYGALAPIGGISAPLPMIGQLVQMNAEWLAAAVLAQIKRPGTAQIYNHLPVVADMRTGAYAAGAVETGILAMALAQMARFYNVPSGGYIGLTNSPIGDAQAGYEKALSTALAAAGGIDFMLVGGLLEALLAFDYGQLVIDNEIALMLKRARQDLDMGDIARAVDEIDAVGPGGMYVSTATTLERMRTAALLPDIAERERREAWLGRGGLDAHARALVRAKRLMAEPNPHALAPEVDARIRSRFDDLVAGDSLPVESWKALLAERPRERRTRRRSFAA
jgi:trimethylamine--corrinoid protein Co-methyltransferase